MNLRQCINSLIFKGAMIYYFSIKLEMFIAEIRPFFANTQKMCFSRFQVIEFSGFCAQRAFRRIATGREHDVYVWVFLRVVSIFFVHAAIHSHLIFLCKPATKLGCKLEPLLRVQLHRNGHIHLSSQSRVLAFFSVLRQQPQVLSADSGTAFRHKNLPGHHALLASKIKYTAIGSRQPGCSSVSSSGYRTSAVGAANGLHV